MIGKAQQGDVYDTAKRMDPYNNDLQLLHRGFRFKTATDSSMVMHSQYNAVKRKENGIQDLGDASTPYLNQAFDPTVISGFITGFNPYGKHYFYNNNARFYNAKLPFTTFYYTQGKSGQSGRGLISFDAMHTQNVGERFNFAVNYHSTTNEGFYLRNTNSMKNIQVSTYYKSKNERYLASGLFTWNKTMFSENGGIGMNKRSDSLFRNPSSTIRYVNVEMMNARNVNRFREHQLKQTYWLKATYSKDTFHKLIPQLGISHQLQWNKQGNYYTDRSTDFGATLYDSIYYFNANYSSDSMGFQNLSNNIEIFTPLNDKGISFLAGISSEQLQYYQSANSNNYLKFNSNNLSVYGQLNFNFLKTYNSEIKGQFYLSGYNQTDYYFHWKNEADIFGKSGWKYKFNLLSSAVQPSYQQQRMLSNHFKWSFDYLQQFQQTSSVELIKKTKRPSVYNAFYYTLPDESLNVRLNYTLLNNYLYYGYDAKPLQQATAENIVQLVVKKNLNLKKFQWHRALTYQVFSSGLKSKILLPAFVSKSSIFYQNYAFKKAAFIQIGADIYYTSSYQAKLYNPATRNFQLSNVSVGNYPFIDLFINAEIKTVRTFFKIEHFNQDIPSATAFPNYFYTSPYQPTALRRFRLGLAWKFYY
ncbi:MAG: putative porin [Bacteroidota bacterium]